MLSTIITYIYGKFPRNDISLHRKCVHDLQVLKPATTPIEVKVLVYLQSQSLRLSASLTTELKFLVVLDKWWHFRNKRYCVQCDP